MASATRLAWQSTFPSSRFAALKRAACVDPSAYARTRNHLDGAVTALSPYFTHGVLSEAETFALWQQKFGIDLKHSLMRELAWRCFYQHVWARRGDAIFADMHAGLTTRAGEPLRYAARLPDDIIEARTGVPVIDATVRRLYATGYLHNHQRLWLASYVVHLRKVHWRAGADWLYGHLQDGDPASNHLSWQWVAATFSGKPYLFNAENVAKFAPVLASPGTVLDVSYDALDVLARSPCDVGAEPGVHPGTCVPPLFTAPPAYVDGTHVNPPLACLAGRQVALVHPWALTRRPGADIVLGVIHLPAHVRLPWSSRRWEFVLKLLRAVCDGVWIGDLAGLAASLATAQQVTMRSTLHAGYVDSLIASRVEILPVPSALPEIEPAMTSFSSYYKHAQKALQRGD